MDGTVFHKHHLVPKHKGGTDDPSNLVKVNIPLHAMLHKILWEEHGHWQDYCAWKALSGQIDSQEIYRMAIEARRGVPLSEEHKRKLSVAGKGKKKPKQSEAMRNQAYRRKSYEITHPDGKVEVIVGLVEFCKQYKLNASNLCQVAKGKKSHANGYRCKELKNDGQ